MEIIEVILYPLFMYVSCTFSTSQYLSIYFSIIESNTPTLERITADICGGGSSASFHAAGGFSHSTRALRSHRDQRQRALWRVIASVKAAFVPGKSYEVGRYLWVAHSPAQSNQECPALAHWRGLQAEKTVHDRTC